MDSRIKFKLLAVGAVFYLGGSAFAQTSGSTVATPASNTSVVQKKTSVLDAIRKHAILSYYGMFTGPGLSTKDWGATRTAEEGRDVMGLFHQVRAGVRISDVDSAGVLIRHVSDLALYDIDDSTSKLSPTDSELLSPRMFYRRNNVVDNKFINLQLEFRADVPTEAAWKERTMITQLGFGQNFTIKTSPAWSVGISFNEAYFVYENKNQRRTTRGQANPNPRLRYAVAPSVAYNFNDVFGISSYAWLDSQSFVGRKITRRDSFGNDYVRVGPSISPNPNINLFPCVQVFTSNAQLNTTTLGFEMSASL